MAYSVAVVHWTYRKNAREIYPLRLQVVMGGKPYFINTVHKVHLSQWDKALRQVIDHPNAGKINEDLRRLVADKEAELLLASMAGQKLTPDIARGKKRDVTLTGFAREIAKKNAAGEIIDSRALTEINRLIAYKGAAVLLTDIDGTWLRKYNDYERARGMEQNTRNATFKWLRKVFRAAVKEKLIREDPTTLFDFPAYVQPDTVYLVEEEKEALFDLLLELPPGRLYSTLVYFLFACYSGARYSDWHKFWGKDMVYDGFLRLRPHKKSRGFVVMPVGKTLAGLLEKVRKLDGPPPRNIVCNDHLRELFPLAQVHMGGKIIQGIHKDPTTHVGRHSFGYLCASKGLPKSTTAELMGISVQTVECYYHLSGENIIKQAAALKDV